MNITAKSRYALKIMMDLALNVDMGQQQRHNIANRQHIPVDFMDQITSCLRNSGLIQSVRGRSGGFLLSKKPSEITLYDIFTSVEDNFYPLKCVDNEPCELDQSCISMKVWKDLYNEIRNLLMSKTLSDICKDRILPPLSEIATGHHSCNKPRIQCGINLAET